MSEEVLIVAAKQLSIGADDLALATANVAI